MKSVGPLWGKTVLAVLLVLVLAGQAQAAPPDPPNYNITIAPEPELIWMNDGYYYLWEGEPPYVMHLTMWWWEYCLWYGFNLGYLPGCENIEYEIYSAQEPPTITDGPGGCDRLSWSGAHTFTVPTTIVLTYTQEYAGYGDASNIILHCPLGSGPAYGQGFDWAFNISNNLGAQTVYLPLVVK